ncbi:MAG: hypothetical protein GXY41_11800 [Phycisphaerae bacterium]|nr:hypothetical protein [Phycisphaerae bacterium]
MSGLKITRLFFDSPKVLGAVDTATRKVFSRFGAFVRRTARGSIRKRKASSAPGAPPSSHTGLLKRFIFFSFDPARKSVVIGPMRLTENNRGDAPSALEYGGTVTVDKKNVTVRSRPYMGPAFEKEKAALPALWRDSVK